MAARVAFVKLVVGRARHRAEPARISGRVLQKVRPGDIVLMHDGHDLERRHRPAGAHALPAILEGLREKGLESVTVSELLRGEP